MKKSKKNLLIVEDDPGLQSQLKWSFSEFEPKVVGDRDSAMSYIRQERPAVVITDLGLPPDPGGNTEGFALLTEALAFDADIKVIVVTGREEIEVGIRSIGMGAYDYYQKPIDAETLKFVVERAFRLQELEDQNRELVMAQAEQETGGLIGCCPQLVEISETVDKIASSSVSVLVLGETGTGKGEIAKSLHNKSKLEGKLVTINCSSIPESLLESELFGHEKGAFTGAVSRKIGQIEYANGGTLFLDEIGDMLYSLQAKILHFLQERKIVRLGGNKEIPVDVRVICATNQNLQERIKEGSFREDLYYRVSEMVLHVPPLRERGADVMLLARSFMRKFAAEQDRKVSGFSQNASIALQAWNWPGNIRELENRVRRAVVMTDSPIIDVKELQLDSEAVDFGAETLQAVRSRAEQKTITKALMTCNSISMAAKVLGVSRPTLYDLVSKYNLESHLPSKQDKVS